MVGTCPGKATDDPLPAVGIERTIDARLATAGEENYSVYISLEKSPSTNKTPHYFCSYFKGLRTSRTIIYTFKDFLNTGQYCDQHKIKT